MCDSYTPSESVSVRTMVAPAYLASTAASTLALVSPVSSFSSDRWGCDWSAVAVTDVLELELAAGVVVVAALALKVPARMPPATTPLAISPAAPPNRRQYFGWFSFSVSILLRPLLRGRV